MSASALKIGSIVRIWNANGDCYYGRGVVQSFCKTWAYKYYKDKNAERFLVPAVVIELSTELNKGMRILSVEGFVITEGDYIEAFRNGNIPPAFLNSQHKVAPWDREGTLYQGGILVNSDSTEIEDKYIQKVRDIISGQTFTYPMDLKEYGIENEVILVTNQEFPDSDRIMELFTQFFVVDSEIISTQVAWVYKEPELSDNIGAILN